jgi:hypothetical protein
MRAFLTLVFALATAQTPTTQITILTPDGRVFVEEFNVDKEKPRVIGIFSPTCQVCLRSCAEFQQVLKRYPDANIDVSVIWAPYSDADTEKIALRAARYLPDIRATHYWDLWRFVSRSYSPVVRTLEEKTWGMFFFYQPGVVWSDAPPEPWEWLQVKRLVVGTEYSKTLLDMRVRELTGSTKAK